MNKLVSGHPDLPACIEMRGDTIYADDQPVAKLLSDTGPGDRFATLLREIGRKLDGKD